VIKGEKHGMDYLVIAGLLEIGWAIGLKYTEGLTKIWPSVWTVTNHRRIVGLKVTS
jgi:multidrug transporter EmrE-like cation transporter